MASEGASASETETETETGTEAGAETGGGWGTIAAMTAALARFTIRSPHYFVESRKEDAR
jgi:hypothetical protein